MIKLNKVTRELFENEDTGQGFYVSIRFRRGMWDAYISDDVKEVYATDVFIDFKAAHEWLDYMVHELKYRRSGKPSTIAWVD